MGFTIKVDIVSAEKRIFSGAAEFVSVSGELGDMGIQVGHAPLLTFLRPGQVRLKHEDGAPDDIFYVSGGILEVQPQLVTILADVAERAKDLDEAEALKAQERAKEMIANKSAEMDYAKGLIELARAMAQLKAIRDYQGRK
jgi:F-type H+-transporting ATPase subunit epsilon